jgi:hypothetical protein
MDQDTHFALKQSIEGMNGFERSDFDEASLAMDGGVPSRRPLRDALTSLGGQ